MTDHLAQLKQAVQQLSVLIDAQPDFRKVLNGCRTSTSRKQTLSDRVALAFKCAASPAADAPTTVAWPFA